MSLPEFQDGDGKPIQKGGVAFSIGGDADSSANDLQARFERFRKDRARDRRHQRDRLGKVEQVVKARSSAMKTRLRALFVERALSYIGAPYHRKYFPDLPSDTLFLDCCGLVRRVLRDLAADFGFTIGGWNQAYQLDTLPMICARDDLVPGDLVFWSGEFFDPSKKPYKYNCVHVEIYLGSHAECQKMLGLDIPQLEGVLGGNATLGSRTAGHVQVHQTYENKPSNQYKITDVFFRSIDTWLNGTCEPCQFQWGTSVPQAEPNSKSIFASQEGAESDEGELLVQKLPASLGGS